LDTGLPTAEDARLPNLLSDLAGHVAWTEPGADTHAAVAKTPAQTMLELSRHS